MSISYISKLILIVAVIFCKNPDDSDNSNISSAKISDTTKTILESSNRSNNNDSHTSTDKIINDKKIQNSKLSQIINDIKQTGKSKIIEKEIDELDKKYDHKFYYQNYINLIFQNKELSNQQKFIITDYLLNNKIITKEYKEYILLKITNLGDFETFNHLKKEHKNKLIKLNNKKIDSIKDYFDNLIVSIIRNEKFTTKQKIKSIDYLLDNLETEHKNQKIIEFLLLISAQQGDFKIYSHIKSKYNVKMNLKDSFKNFRMNYIMTAASGGNVNILKDIISEYKNQKIEFDINNLQTDHHKDTILERSVSSKDDRYQITKFILEELKAKITKSVFNEAIRWGNYSLVKLLIENGADIFGKTDDLGRTPIHAFAASTIEYQKDNIEIGELLLNEAKRIDPKTDYINILDKQNLTALWWACRYGNSKRVDWLLSNGAKINIGKDPIDKIGYYLRNETVNVLLKHKINLNNKNLLQAASSYLATHSMGYLEGDPFNKKTYDFFETMLNKAKVTDINNLDNYGQTIMHNLLIAFYEYSKYLEHISEKNRSVNKLNNIEENQKYLLKIIKLLKNHDYNFKLKSNSEKLEKGSKYYGKEKISLLELAKKYNMPEIIKQELTS